MAKDKKKVYFSKATIRPLVDNTPITNQTVISEVFAQLCTAYDRAIANGDTHSFQLGSEETDMLIITDLHLVSDRYLCGRIGRCSEQVTYFLRESNPQTFTAKELEPSAGNLFEDYSYFAISLSKLQIAYLRNDKVSQKNMPSIIAKILQNNLGSLPYAIEVNTLLDYDIKEKIKNLKDEIAVSGIIAGQEQQIVGGMQSLRDIERAMGSKFAAKIKLKAKISKTLNNSDIDIIIESATTDAGFSSFTLAEACDEEKEVVDVVKRQAYLTKTILLSQDEQKQPQTVWERICSVF